MTLTTTLRVEPVGERAVRITRSFTAPRQDVFDAHTQPELLRRWLGPATWTLTECDIDLRPGGSFRYLMHGPDGEEMVVRGEFREVDAPSRLVTTESFSDNWTGGETVNTTTFDEVGGVTTVTVIIEYASAESRAAALATGMEGGMAEGFNRLDALLVEGAIGARYRRRAERFDALVAAVDPARWDDPSPCAGWRARDVVGHIVDMHDVMLRPAGRSLSAAPSIEDDPVAAFRSARADVEALLADHDAVTAECDMPMGRMTVAHHIDAVMSMDLPLHGWDIARAVGLDDTIDPADVAAMWPEIEQLPEEMRIPEHFGPGVIVFGPEVPVPDDAPLQDRLLGKIGRDPHWRPPVTSS
jgi:uncharacterized protein (TIGR03086 family)